ncbi:MAG: DNA-binding protein [Ruminococcaceae bacterium]|nr:DNA-binding protein [Oscillospiraceae bacterium]
MFEKNMRFVYLLDFYADLLDEHTRGVMQAYYEDDLSLAEVAEDVGISRQGVRHLIKKGEELLEFFESKLGLAAKDEEFSLICELLKGISERLAKSEEFYDDAKQLLKISEAIMKGNQDVRESN